MDSPTPPASSASEAAHPAPIAASAPATPAATDGPAPSRSAQLALGAILAVALGLLAFRGYGNGLATRPIERVAAAITDLNRADRAELEQVPGIGPSLAKAIDDHRAKKGPFKSMEELRQVKGIGPATFEKVVPYLQIDPASLPPTEPQSPPSDSSSPEPLVLERKSTPTAPPPVPKSSGNAKKMQPGDPPIDVNAATLEELTRLPGIGPATAKHIVDARTEHPFKTLADLDKVKGIGPKTLEKIRPFISLK